MSRKTILNPFLSIDHNRVKNMVLAKLANLALSSLLQTEYFTSAADNPKIDRQEIARVGTGPQKVGSYSKS